MRTPKLFGMFLGIVFLVLLFLVGFGNYYVPSIGIPEVKPLKNNVILSGSEGSRDSSASLQNDNGVVRNNDQSEEIPDHESNSASQVRNDNTKLDGWTELIAQQISEDILELNPDGPVEFEGERAIILSNPNKVVEKILTNELAKIRELSLASVDPIILINDSKIIKGANKQTEEIYFETFKKIIKEEFSGLETDLSKTSTADYEKILAAHKKIINRFYQLNVPESLLEIHKKELLLLTQQERFFEKIKEGQQKPLEAILALSKYTKETAQGMVYLVAEIGRFIESNQLAVQWP